MTQFVQSIILGTGTGALDALLALGIVVIYRTTGVLNFAQASTGALAAYVMFSVSQGRPLWFAIAVGIAVGAGVGVATYGVVNGIRSRHYALTAAVATLAVAVLLQQVIAIGWGTTVGLMPDPFSTTPIITNGLIITVATLAGIISAVTLATALGAYLKWTRIGTMLRALADHREAAQLCGGNVTLLTAGVWAVAGALAAIAAFYAALLGLTPSFLDQFFVTALLASVLGGLRSLMGTFVGAIALEIARNMFGLYAPGAMSAYTQTFLICLIIVILAVAPRRWLAQGRERTV